MRSHSNEANQHPNGVVPHFLDVLREWDREHFIEMHEFFNDHLLLTIEDNLFEEAEYRGKYALYLTIMGEMAYALQQYSREEFITFMKEFEAKYAENSKLTGKKKEVSHA